MNGTRSDETNSNRDIFILSVRETVFPLLPDTLEKKGYKVTLFTDGKNLLETLKQEKPDLLICNTTSSDKETFEICRHIKKDNDLWVIPVLILTNVSMISDLIHILECNADNFLPLPFDLPFGLSIIENMLGTPVERQVPDQIKTQFKVRHDDQTYVVAASRRKLLELLLSSFEIVVTTSSALSHVKTDLQTLAESVKFLKDRLNDQTRLIDTIQAALHQKEQKILALTFELEEKQKLLAQKTRKAFIVTDDETSQTAFPDKKGSEMSSFSEINLLRQQISELEHEVDITKTNLDAVQKDLEEEKMHCTSLECTLELLDQQKELAMQAKTQSEQELSQIIDDLNKKNEDQAVDLTRLRSELEHEVSRRISAENQVGSLILEKEKTESLVRPREDSLRNHLEDLQLQLETTRAALENEKSTTKLHKEHLAEIVADHEKTDLRVKEELESGKAKVIGLRRDLDDATAIQNALKRDIDDLTLQNKAVEAELNLVNQSLTQSDQQVGLLTGELEKIQTAFDNERRLHEENEKRIDTLLHTLQLTEQNLLTSDEEKKTLKDYLENERKLRESAEDTSRAAGENMHHLEQELRRVTDQQVRQENDHAIRIKNLEEELSRVRNQNNSLRKQANALIHERILAEQKVNDLPDKHDRARNEVGEEGLDHQSQDCPFVRSEEKFPPRKQAFTIEETPAIILEHNPDGIVKKEPFPYTEKSSSHAFRVPLPGEQKSPDPEKELTSSKSSSPVPEISQKTVNDIVTSFSDDDIFEEI